jgi:hypothetical protein
VFILFFEELIINAQAQMCRLCGNLGVDETFYSSYPFYMHNPTISVRYRWLNKITIRLEPVIAGARSRLLHNPDVLRIFERALTLGKSAYRKINDRGGASHEQIPPQTLARLAKYYHPFNQELSRLLARPLPWKSYKSE